MKWLKRIGLVLAIFLIVYFAGPTPAKPHYYTNWPNVPTITELDQWIAQKEGQHHLRKDNEARIVWADSMHRVTPYALVYLHGFSASQEEGDPVHRDLARRFGCN
ncbi:MAG TPA: alpha/beta hydrolase, partial [Ferruginibacter sp.]|nr:alpha/beta hydrolase [Ferruginibacter sp.]